MGRSDVFRAVLGDASGEVYTVGFNEEAIEDLLDVLDTLESPPTVNLLAGESILKWLREDFLLASAAAELDASETLSMKAVEEPFKNCLIVTEESVTSVIEANGRVAGLVTDDGAFVKDARERWTHEWDTAEEFSLRTPTRSRVHDSLTEQVGPDVEADFRTMMRALGTARGGDHSLDEVMVSLLTAANNEALLYDISRWGEDVGVASTATFSQTKMLLEERGLLDTEKVPIDVGRPRLRLLLGDERLQKADAAEIASVARGLLAIE